MAVSQRILDKIQKGEKLDVPADQSPKLAEVLEEQREAKTPPKKPNGPIRAVGRLGSVSHMFSPGGNWDKEKESVYLYGSVTYASYWRQEIFGHLKPYGLQFLNPKTWDNTRHTTQLEVDAQMKWEMEALQTCDRVIFWFDGPVPGKFEYSIWPNAWFDLAYAIAKGKKVYIGAHPNYLRLKDLKLRWQKYANKQFHESINNMVKEVVDDLKKEYGF